MADSFDPYSTDPYYYKRLRDSLSRDDPRHAALGPLEHRDFVRETVAQGNPLMALALAAGTPAYTALKYVAQNPSIASAMPRGIGPGMLSLANSIAGRARSPASIDEMLAAYQGLFSGIKDKYF